MPGQLLSAGFAFCNVLLLSAYTANLAASFTVRLATAPVSGIEDIARGAIQPSRVSLGNLGGSIQAFWGKQFPALTTRCYNCLLDPSGETADLQFARLKAGDIDYIVHDAHSLMSTVAADPDCSTEVVGEIFYSQSYSFITPHGSLLASRVSAATLALRERMRIDAITKDYLIRAGVRTT